MEERQTKITEGAGLEESRLNREFIDWLSRWSTPILLLVIVVAGGYILYQRIQQGRLETLNQAFIEFEAAAGTASPNPRALEDIAQTYRGIRSVPHLANLAAADEYLRAARLGAAPGAQIMPDGTIAAADQLTEEQRNRYLADAERLYTSTFQATEADSTKALIAISAAYGIAAVREFQGRIDDARAQYERIAALADRTGYASHITLARQRIENLSRIAERPRLFAAAELPALPTPPQPPPPDPGAFELMPGGSEGVFQGSGFDPSSLLFPGLAPEGGQPQQEPVDPPAEPGSSEPGEPAPPPSQEPTNPG